MKKYSICGKEFSKSELEIWAWEQLGEAPGWEKSHLIFILQWLGKNTHIIVTTSGSTGTPKSIELSKSDMISSALLTAEVLDCGKGTRALLCLPSVYIAGKMMLVRSLVNRWQLHWTEPSANPLADTTSEFDFAAMTPMQVNRCLEESMDKFNNIKTVLVGGSHITPVLEEKLQKCSNRCIASYGMTETITHVALRILNGPEAHPHFTALPGVTFASDHRGCLIVKAKHLGGNEIITNDLVDLIDKEHFKYIGRADNVVNSGGVKLFPEQIESRIAHLFNSRFIIHKTEDIDLGESLVLYIEGWPLASEKMIALQAGLEELLHPYEIPKKIEHVIKFEETGTGKIIRRKY